MRGGDSSRGDYPGTNINAILDSTDRWHGGGRMTMTA